MFICHCCVALLVSTATSSGVIWVTSSGKRCNGCELSRWKILCGVDAGYCGQASTISRTYVFQYPLPRLAHSYENMTVLRVQRADEILIIICGAFIFIFIAIGFDRIRFRSRMQFWTGSANTSNIGLDGLRNLLQR